MLSIKFNEPVSEKIIDFIGIKMREGKRFAYLENGKNSKTYADGLINEKEIREQPGPRFF